MQTALLLTASNLFMTIAWYGHLKFPTSTLWKVILISWLIAFFEYCLQVPANRIGATTFSKTQLKIMQEIISVLVFVVFAALYFKELPRWNHWIAFALIVAAVAFAFWPGSVPSAASRAVPPPGVTSARPPASNSGDSTADT